MFITLPGGHRAFLCGIGLPRTGFGGGDGMTAASLILRVRIDGVARTCGHVAFAYRLSLVELVRTGGVEGAMKLPQRDTVTWRSVLRA